MGLLQPGITGFGTSAAVPVGDFKRALYAGAKTGGATVTTVRPGEGPTPNFHQADVGLASGPLVVLCNRHVPVVAFANRIDGMEIAHFVPAPPSFAEALAESGFAAAAADELNRRVEPKDLDALSPAERRQAKYWKPKRVGDIVFNWWD